MNRLMDTLLWVLVFALGFFSVCVWDRVTMCNLAKKACLKSMIRAEMITMTLPRASGGLITPPPRPRGVSLSSGHGSPQNSAFYFIRCFLTLHDDSRPRL